MKAQLRRLGHRRDHPPKLPRPELNAYPCQRPHGSCRGICTIGVVVAPRPCPAGKTENAGNEEPPVATHATIVTGDAVHPCHDRNQVIVRDGATLYGKEKPLKQCHPADVLPKPQAPVGIRSVPDRLVEPELRLRLNVLLERLVRCRVQSIGSVFRHQRRILSLKVFQELRRGLRRFSDDRPVIKGLAVERRRILPQGRGVCFAADRRGGSYARQRSGSDPQALLESAN